MPAENAVKIVLPRLFGSRSGARKFAEGALAEFTEVSEISLIATENEAISQGAIDELVQVFSEHGVKRISVRGLREARRAENILSSTKLRGISIF